MKKILLFSLLLLGINSAKADCYDIVFYTECDRNGMTCFCDEWGDVWEYLFELSDIKCGEIGPIRYEMR